MNDLIRGFRDGWKETRVSKRLVVGASAAGAMLASAALVLGQIA